MLISPLTFFASASQAVAETIPSSGPTSFQTVLLIIIAGALLFLVRSQAKLNTRLASLEAAKTATTQPASIIQTPPNANSSPKTNDSVPPQIVAAISAAIHTTLRARYRIVSVGEICPHRQAWSAEGRRQVFSSHKVR